MSATLLTIQEYRNDYAQRIHAQLRETNGINHTTAVVRWAATVEAATTWWASHLICIVWERINAIFAVPYYTVNSATCQKSANNKFYKLNSIQQCNLRNDTKIRFCFIDIVAYMGNDEAISNILLSKFSNKWMCNRVVQKKHISDFFPRSA